MHNLDPSINSPDIEQCLIKARELVKRRRTNKHAELDAAPEVVSRWPETWLAVALCGMGDLAGHIELGLSRVLVLPHTIVIATSDDDASTSHADDLLARLQNEAQSSGRERVALLESVWRAHPAPETADLVQAADARIEPTPIPKTKRKSDYEKAWIEAALASPLTTTTPTPRDLFSAPWPTHWREAQRRMNALYTQPRSPRLAAAALTLASRDPRPYTSIASQVFWQGLAWFIAEQGDDRPHVVDALEVFETSLARFVGRKETPATDALRALGALRARSQAPLSPRAQQIVTKLRAELGAAASPGVPGDTAPAAMEERLVWADQAMLAGNVRGELVVIQERIVKTIVEEQREPPADLLKREAQLIKKHAKEWCPKIIHKGTCVFARGAPVAGHLLFRSERELASLSGSSALATFESLIVDSSFAMGSIKTATIADLVRSLARLKMVMVIPVAATEIAQGKPTSIEHLYIGPGGFRDSVSLEGEGLPRLARLDVAGGIPKRWLGKPWLTKTPILGCSDPQEWPALHAAVKASATVTSIVLCLAQHPLHRGTPASVAERWELVAERASPSSFESFTIEPRPTPHAPGVTEAGMIASLADFPSWKSVTALRIPKDFCSKELQAFAKKKKVPVKAIDACFPARLGRCLDLLSLKA